MKLKILVVGLGSMGKRRIRNLRALGVSDIFGFDKNKKIQKTVAKEYKVLTIQNLSELSTLGLDLVIVSTPPQYHLEPILECIQSKINFFSEYNLITKDVEEIIRHTRTARVLGLPSHTEDYDLDLRRLRKELSKGTFGYFVFHLGQNIHTWHPWQEPGQHFIFKPAVNGIREILRAELPWIVDQFGPVVNIQSQKASIFTKKYKVPDYLQVHLVFKSGMRGTLIFDLISTDVIKRFEAVGENCLISWEEREKLIKIKKRGKEHLIRLKNGRKLKNYKFEEDAFVAEMQQVVRLLISRKPPEYSFDDELRLLQLIDNIEKGKLNS